MNTSDDKSAPGSRPLETEPLTEDDRICGPRSRDSGRPADPVPESRTANDSMAEKVRQTPVTTGRAPMLIAAILALLLVVWMGSGYIWPVADKGDGASSDSTVRTKPSPGVQVTASIAKSIATSLVADGDTRPARITPIRAESSGLVQLVSIEKGDTVSKGQQIARLKPESRGADVAEAQAEVDRARTEYDATEKLARKEYASRASLARAKAALASANAKLAAARQSVASTSILSPFSGVVNELTIEPGEYIGAGSSVGTVVDIASLQVVINVPESAVASMKPGMKADLEFVSIGTRQGEIKYIASDADLSTRTFRVDVSVSNADATLRGGMSARVTIPVDQIQAHFISPALLSLKSDGRLCVKLVDDDNQVTSHIVTIQRSEAEGIWVSGLPEQAKIITVGHGFVDDGDTVSIVPANNG